MVPCGSRFHGRISTPRAHPSPQGRQLFPRASPCCGDVGLCLLQSESAKDSRDTGDMSSLARSKTLKCSSSVNCKHLGVMSVPFPVMGRGRQMSKDMNVVT